MAITAFDPQVPIYATQGVRLTGNIYGTPAGAPNPYLTYEIANSRWVFADDFNAKMYVNADQSVEVLGGVIASIIRRATLDGADNSFVQIAGGGAADVSRGALIQVLGNEHGGTGQCQVIAGNVVGGHIIFFTGAAVERARIADEGFVLIGTTDVTNMTAGDVRLSKALWIGDGVVAPTEQAGFAAIYVDSADGDLKIKFGDGTVKTIATDT